MFFFYQKKLKLLYLNLLAVKQKSSETYLQIQAQYVSGIIKTEFWRLCSAVLQLHPFNSSKLQENSVTWMPMQYRKSAAKQKKASDIFSSGSAINY